MDKTESFQCVAKLRNEFSNYIIGTKVTAMLAGWLLMCGFFLVMELPWGGSVFQMVQGGQRVPNGT